MSHELFYTSVPRGLKSGSKGFCTVAMTRGLPTALAERLESLSGYRPLFPAGQGSASDNPVSFSHWRISVAGRTWSVLSRVCCAGFDYTQRTNKFAHHLALEASETAPGGPAWLMQQSGVLETQWSGEPKWIEVGRSIPAGDSALRVCSAWADLCGDAGWAGVVAETLALEQNRPTWLVYPVGADMLPLVEEVLSLLPARQRWQMTYNTYFTELPAGLACTLRCCVDGSPMAAEARRQAATGSLVVDLTQPLGAPADSPFVEAARTGMAPDAELAVGDGGSIQLAGGEPSAFVEEPAEEVATEYALSRGGSDSPATPEPADQSWMPPISATRVERAEAEESRRTIVWPWIVLAATGWAAVIVLFLMRMSVPPTQLGQAAKPTSVPAEAQIRIDAEAAAELKYRSQLQSYAKDLTDAKTQVDRLEAQHKADEIAAGKLKATCDGLSNDVKTNEATITELRKIVASLPVGPVTTPARVVPVPTTQNTQPQPPVSHTPLVVPLPSEKKPAMVIWPPPHESASKVTSIQLNLPTVPQDKPVYVTKGGDREWVVTRKKKGGFDPKEQNVASFRTDGATVTFIWDNPPDGEDIRSLKGMSLAVRLEGLPERLIQFRDMPRLRKGTWGANDKLDIFDDNLPDDVKAIHLRGELESSTQALWDIQMEPTGGLSVSYRKNQHATFRLVFDSKSGKVVPTLKAVIKALFDELQAESVESLKLNYDNAKKAHKHAVDENETRMKEGKKSTTSGPDLKALADTESQAELKWRQAVAKDHAHDVLQSNPPPICVFAETADGICVGRLSITNK